MRFRMLATSAVLAIPVLWSPTTLAHGAEGHRSDEKAAIVFDQPITNLPGKSMIAVAVEIAPGGSSPSHKHADSAFIYAYVLSGMIETQINDGPRRTVKAGESFFETPGSNHPYTRNLSKTAPAKLLAVFVVDTADRELTTPNK